MLPRIFGTAISFLVVVVAYSGYALLVVPCIDPPANADSNGPVGVMNSPGFSHPGPGN